MRPVPVATYQRAARWLREEHARLRAEANRARAILRDPTAGVLAREDAENDLAMVWHGGRTWLDRKRKHEATCPERNAHLSPAAAARHDLRHAGRS